MATAIEDIVDRPAPSRLRPALALWTILAAQLMLQMDFLIVIVALPRIQNDLGFTSAGLSWVPNAFALAFGGLLLLGGRLGDLWGRVRAFQIGIGVFVLASLAGGLAQTPTVLIAARIVQGMAAALAAPSVLALVTTLAKTEAERNKGLSLFIAVSSIGASLGLVLGGTLTDLASWRWSLLINVPVGAVVLLLIGKLVSETPARKARLDVAGAIVATLGSSLLVYGLIAAAERGWASIDVAVSFPLAAAMLLAFVLIERRVSDPLLDLSLLKDRTRASGLIIMAMICGMHFSMLFLIVQFLQRVLGFNPLLTGLAYIPLTATVFAVTHFAPKMIAHLGVRPLLMAGCVIVASSLLALGQLDASSSYGLMVLPTLVVHALGLGLVFTPATVAVMHGVARDHAGTASGLLQMDQQIGGALGIAIITAAYAAGSTPGQFIPGLSGAFVLAAMIALLASVVAWIGLPAALAPTGATPPTTHL